MKDFNEYQIKFLGAEETSSLVLCGADVAISYNTSSAEMLA